MAGEDHLARLRMMHGNLTGAVGATQRLERRALAWAIEQIGAARAQAFTEAADFATFYADERLRLCQDSILHDPVLSAGRGARVSDGDIAKSRELQVDGTINSAGYHAATHIAEHLRELAKEAAG